MGIFLKIRSFFVLCLAAALLSGCGANDSPDHAAKQFWNAMANNDIEQARELASSDSASRVSLQNGKVIENIQFSDDIEFDGSNKNKASVATQLDLYYSDESRQTEEPFQLSFNTDLVKEQGVWKVDFDNTLGSMVGSTIVELGSDLKNSLQQAGEAAVELTNEAMLEAMIEMTDALQAAAEKMHEAAQEMKEGREQDQEETQQDGQTEVPSEQVAEPNL
jgi:hypothetical protein